METFDILDCRGEKTGETIARDDAHRTGAWHGAFHCLIIYERDGRRQALFQKRSLHKKIAPGKFDVSVGGHYSAGEDAAAAGPREIREELGIEVKFADLIRLGRRVFVYCFTADGTECEFQDIFLLPRAIEPAKLALQQEEVDGALEMEVEQGIELFSGKVRNADASLYKTGMMVKRVSVAMCDFVPCLDSYYLKLLLIARRYFDGERALLVI
jgi:isopentenyldiphosphate isomerase